MLVGWVNVGVGLNARGEARGRSRIDRIDNNLMVKSISSLGDVDDFRCSQDKSCFSLRYYAIEATVLCCVFESAEILQRSKSEAILIVMFGEFL